MQVKLKTLKGDCFEVRAAADMPIRRVKELACESDKGREGGWELEGLKLIFQGKVLDNDKDLATCAHGAHELEPRARRRPASAPPLIRIARDVAVS